MLAAPPTSLPSQRELAAHYRTIADAVDKPVVLYNYPARAGVEIGFDCLDVVADHPNIVAIKESSGDFSRFLHLQQRYAGRLDIMRSARRARCSCRTRLVQLDSSRRRWGA